VLLAENAVRLAAGTAQYRKGAVTVTLNNALVSSNAAGAAQPGNGGKGFPGDSGAGGSYGSTFGGGIYLNQKASMTSDTIESNIARVNVITLRRGVGSFNNADSPAGSGAAGGAGGTGGGGGLYVAGGTVTLTGCFIEHNQAVGSGGGNAFLPGAGTPGLGGAGQGGGVDIQGGTVTISKSQIKNNVASGGFGGGIHNTAGTRFVSGSPGGGAAGGGLYAGGGTIHLTLDVIQGNEANAGVGTEGNGPQSPNASGGGLYVVTGTTVTQDAFTLGNLVNNTDTNNDGNDNFGTGGAI